VIRVATHGDAEAFLGLQLALDEQSSLMMLEVGERSTDLVPTQTHLQQVTASRNSTILVTEVDARLVGYVEAEGGRYRRTRHVAQIVLGVRAEYWRRGIGRALLEALEARAVEHRIERLELTVRTDNPPARALYTPAGFIEESVRRGSLRVANELVDEISMARILNYESAPTQTSSSRVTR
jgi:ribosomal protein S18 acetylase RimI-like enzyme